MIDEVMPDEYQTFTKSTAIYPDANKKSSQAILYCVLGLVGESGEVAEKVKRAVRAQGVSFYPSPLREDLKRELGDILWYAARLSDELGISLSDVISTNMSRLTDRKTKVLTQTVAEIN